MLYSINLLFMLLLTISTIIVMSSPSWFCMWIGIEMNTMAFIPIMYQFNNKLPTESALKYFLTQTFASMIMLLSIIMMMYKDFYNLNSSSNMMLLSMGIKLGAAPFHMWYPSVVEGLSWLQNIILMTWQKIAPLVVMFMTQPTFMNIIMTLSSLSIGPISALNQTSLRKIMAYSSITHMSWMIIMMMNKSLTWVSYMLIYFITTMIVLVLFQIFNTNHTTQMNLKNINQTFIMFITLLSMGGFPPLLGFIGKWLVLNELIKSSMTMIAILLVLSSCINLYIYLRIIHPLMHLNSLMIKNNMINNLHPITLSMISATSLFSLYFIILM